MKPDAVGAGSVDAILDAIRAEGIEILARGKKTLTPEDVAQLHGGEAGCCGGGGGEGAGGAGGAGAEGEDEDVIGSGAVLFLFFFAACARVCRDFFMCE